MSNYVDVLRQIAEEYGLEKTDALETSFRLSILTSFYPNLFKVVYQPNEPTLELVRFNTKRTLFSKPSEIKLRELYEETSTKLSFANPNVVRGTVAEHALKRALKKHNKCKAISSLWIGKKNVDLFIPTLSGRPTEMGRCFTGVAIEVDGPIHQDFHKALKDNAKESLLQFLGILVLRIENFEIFRKSNLEQFRASTHFKKLDTRAKRRLWIKIYLVTIILNLPTEKLEALFKCEFKRLRKKFFRALTGVPL